MAVAATATATTRDAGEIAGEAEGALTTTATATMVRPPSSPLHGRYPLAAAPAVVR